MSSHTLPEFDMHGRRPPRAHGVDARTPFNPLNHLACMQLPKWLKSYYWHEHIPFAFAAIDALRPRRVMDLGTVEGNAFCAFCQTLQVVSPASTCLGVAPWNGEEGEATEDAADVAHFRQLRAYQNTTYKGFSRLATAGQEHARTGLADGSIDLLHMDHAPNAAAARRAFTAWLPKVDPHGVVLIHNVNPSGDDDDLSQWWAELQGAYPTFTFGRGRGLGVLTPTPGGGSALASLFHASHETRMQLDVFYGLLGDRIEHECELAFGRSHGLELAKKLDALNTDVAELRADVDQVRHHREPRRRAGPYAYLRDVERRLRHARKARRFARKAAERGSLPTPTDVAPTDRMYMLLMSGCPLDDKHLVGASRRYRCEHQAEQLRLQGLAVDTAYVYDVNFPAVLDRYSAFLLHRVAHTPELELFIAEARRLGKTVIFDTDDLIFDWQQAQHVRALDAMTPEEKRHYIEGVTRYNRTLQLCTAAIVTTDGLADAVREHYPTMPVYVNRNCLNDEMVAQAEQALAEEPGPAEDHVCIAYFSGTKTHDHDFLVCAPAVLRVLKEHPHVRLVVAGHLELPAAFADHEAQIDRLPFRPWQELPRAMRRVDINLAPLEFDNPYTAAKSELKYFEAGLLGIPTVASALPAYETAISSGDNGVLCDGQPDSWYQALHQLILDPQLRHTMGARARDDVGQRYTTRSRSFQFAHITREVQGATSSGEPRSLRVVFVMHAPIAQAGGGYKNIFILGNYLADRGHHVHYYVTAADHLQDHSEAEIVQYCREHFGVSQAHIHVRKPGDETFVQSDVAIATWWPTAYEVDRIRNTERRAYLIQDYEPEFYPASDARFQEADGTYDLFVKKIALGKYLGRYMTERDRFPVPHIKFALDRTIFRKDDSRNNAGPVRILFFARPHLRRRAYPIGIKALELIKQAHPEAEIVFYGMAEQDDLPFDYVNLGEISREAVAEEMRRSHIHLSFSLTNISWVAFEGMACGCAVVEAQVPSMEMWADGATDIWKLAEPEPEAVAEAVGDLIADPDARQRIAENGHMFVDTITDSWDGVCKQFEALLLDVEAKGAVTSERIVLGRCPVCRGVDSEEAYTFTDAVERWSVRICEACAFNYLDPRYSLRETIRLEEANSKYADPLDAEFESQVSQRAPMVGFLEKYVNGRRILDVGCSYGAMLAAAQRRGWDVYGIEPCHRTRELAHQRLGPCVSSFPLDADSFPGITFDVVSLCDALEHVHNPLETLSLAKRKLAPGGVVFASLPNLDGYREETDPEIRTQLFNSIHVNYFTEDTLRDVFQRAGYHVEWFFQDTELRRLSILGTVAEPNAASG